jgi:GTP-binding protein
MQYHDAVFLTSAVRPDQWPAEDLPEIVFAGRSNAGKSTLINSLLNRKAIAYTGKTPGRTRLLNFFRVDAKMIFTDAPGYGYASGDTSSAKDFGKLMEPYFQQRKQLKAMVLVLDARRVPNDDDLTMCSYARSAHLAIIPVLTKMDKLSRSQLLNNAAKAGQVLNIPAGGFYPVSALKKQGMDEVWQRINQIVK